MWWVGGLYAIPGTLYERWFIFVVNPDVFHCGIPFFWTDGWIGGGWLLVHDFTKKTSPFVTIPFMSLSKDTKLKDLKHSCKHWSKTREALQNHKVYVYGYEYIKIYIYTHASGWCFQLPKRKPKVLLVAFRKKWEHTKVWNHYLDIDNMGLHP